MITAMCKVFSSLPGPGGVLDQDPYLMEAMMLVQEAHNEAEERAVKKAK